MKAGEVITGIRFSLPGKNENLRLYKASQRKDLDISAVNAAFRVIWTNGKKSQVKKAYFALGGVAAIPLRLPKTESLFNGKEVKADTISAAIHALQNEITPLSDLRASAAYRRIVAENFFRSFFQELKNA